MPSLDQFKQVLAAVPTTVATIRAGVAARATAQNDHDTAVSAENLRHNQAIEDENTTNTNKLKEIEDAFTAATADLPVDPAAAEAEVQEFLNSLASVISAVQAGNPA